MRAHPALADSSAEQPQETAKTDPPVTRHRTSHLLLTGGLVGVLILGLPVLTSLVGGASLYEPIFFEYPGAPVSAATTVALAGADAGAMLSLGSLVHLLFLRARPARRVPWIRPDFELRLLRTGAAIWTLGAVALVPLEALNSNGLTFSDLADPRAIVYVSDSLSAATPWMVNSVAALLVLLAAWYGWRWTSLLMPLWAGLIAVLAPVLTGHVLVGPNHDIGSDAAVFQTIAAYLLFGTIAVGALRVASGRLLHQVVLRRTALIATVCLPVLIMAQAALVPFTLAGTPITGSATGYFLLIQSACLLALIVVVTAGVRRARRGGLREHHVRQLFLAGFTVTAVWAAVATAESLVPPPQYFADTSIAQVYLGFETPLPPTAYNILTQWRPNVLFLGVAAGAVGLYLGCVAVLRRRGDSWPAGRTWAWLLGWIVVVLATSSGLGRYSGPDFGIHMIGHMTLNMLAPGLLVLGGVMTLLLRTAKPRPAGAAGVHEWLTWLMHWRGMRVLFNPLLVFVLYITSYYGLYLTPLFGEYMKYHWFHQLMNVHFVIVGYLYYSLVVGVDRTPRPLPHIAKLGYVLAAMPFHAFFGVILMSSHHIIAEQYYHYLDMPWANLTESQFFAGGVAWAGGELPLIMVIIILALQWARQDARTQRRTDRSFDRTHDSELETYNEMMRALAQRDHPSRAGSDQEATR